MCFQRVGQYAPTTVREQRIFMKNSHDVLLKEAVFGLVAGFLSSFVNDYSQTSVLKIRTKGAQCAPSGISVLFARVLAGFYRFHEGLESALYGGLALHEILHEASGVF